MKRTGFTLIELIVVIVIVAVLYSALFDGGRALVLCFGWIPRTFWLAYRLVVHSPLFVLATVAAFFGIASLLHFPLRYFRKQWEYRQSLAVTGLLASVVVALAGISTAFDFGNELRRPKLPVRKSADFLRWNRQSKERLEKWAAHAAQFAGEHENRLPLGGTVLNDGCYGHGWITQLLPYMDQQDLYSKIDLKKPWDAPENAPVYCHEDRWHRFRSPKSKYDFDQGRWKRSESFYKDEDGFQLTDYAANEHIMGPGRSLQLDDISDGLSQTILFGEASENLKPWGSPLNCRDPALGVNRSPYGFGFAFPDESVNFAMCDGSVRRVSEKVAPEIMRALATPNGGEEPVSEDVFIKRRSE